MPITKTQIANTLADTIRTACTQKKDVGALSQAAPLHARESSTIALAKRGQMTTLKTPAMINTQLANLEITHAIPSQDVN